MRSKRHVLAAFAAAVTLVVVVVGVLVARGTGPAQPVATPSASGGADDRGAAVSFAGRDVATGNAVALADFRGKPVVVNIWASWCPGCNAEARALGEFAKAHPEAAFVGVNFQDSESAARAFYERYRWTFPSVYDPDGEIAYELALQGTPTTIFLDRAHREVTRIVGETDEQGFAQGLAAATRP